MENTEVEFGALSGFCLRLYNVYFFCFTAFVSIGLPWTLHSGQRGLPVSEGVGTCIGVVLGTLTGLSVLGNCYLIGLTLWLLAHRRPELGWMRRLLSVALVFVPVWGVRRFQHLVGSGEWVDGLISADSLREIAAMW
jgi:hypothetical protein